MRPAIIAVAVSLVFVSACAIPHILSVSERPRPQAFEWWIAFLPEQHSIILTGALFGVATFIWSRGSEISNSLVAVSCVVSFFAFSLWITSLNFVVIITSMREDSPKSVTEYLDDILWPVAALALVFGAKRSLHGKGT